MLIPIGRFEVDGSVAHVSTSTLLGSASTHGFHPAFAVGQTTSALAGPLSSLITPVGYAKRWVRNNGTGSTSKRHAKEIPTSGPMTTSSVYPAPLNPYVVGGALGDPGGRGFYGREDILEFVRSALYVEQRPPILLYGQRRIGKSSVLMQLTNKLSPELVCVFFDLQGKASMQLDQVLYGLGRAIADRLKIPRPEREEATEDGFATAVLARAIQALDNRPERLVLLFDEFDVVDERFAGSHVAASRFIGFLGNLINTEPRVGYILVVGRKTEELSEEFTSALLKNSVQKRIGRFKKEQSARVVQELSQGYLRFTDSALDRIYALASGHPFCTQVLCHAVWSRLVAGNVSFPIEVTPSQVEDALLPAMEFGTNGLNWIFDGLTNATHRLFLSSLAAVADPASGAGASFSTIEKSLLDRHVAVDTSELNRAPEELERWDVIEKGHDGFQFAVPMVGVWIRRERSLDQLEKEVRYANPRAHRYYELAVEEHRSGDLDRAITDYEGALHANPTFLEAQRGLAAALRDRRKPGDLEAAIEAHERVLELDPETPPTALLQVLVESLESSETSPEKLPIRYKRISELDSDRTMLSRARRVLNDRALSILKAESYKDAETIFKALGDDNLAKTAHTGRVRATLAVVGAAIIGTGAPLIRIIFGLPVEPETRLVVWALTGSAWGSLLFPMWFGEEFANRRLSGLQSDKVATITSHLLSPSIIGALLRVLFGVLLGSVVGYIFLRILGRGYTAPISAFVTSLYYLLVPSLRGSAVASKATPRSGSSEVPTPNAEESETRRELNPKE